MAKTKNGIVYPDNYDKVADVPADLKELAESVDEVIENNKTEMKKSNETRDGKISKNTENIEAIQGSIKTAIETINKKDNEQDEDIKANKESIEELKAENLEIKVENERLRNDIKSIALPGEASGENIHLEDSSDARCELEISGNQKQDVRIGKNKLLNDTASMTINGVTFTKNDDGSVIANGTATDGINYYLSEISTTIEAGIYKLSDGVNDESSTTYFTYVDCKNEDGSAYDAGNLSTVGESSKAYSEPKLIRGRIVVRKGITLSNVLFKPQLELVKSVNDVATDYEQYGASPSIDYPSEIKKVSGSAKVKFQNRNIAPILNLGTNWEYTDKGIKNLVRNSGNDITNFSVKKGNKIEIALNLFSKPTSDTTIIVYVNNKETSALGFGSIHTYNLNQIYKRTYTATEDCKIRMTMYGNANSDIFEFQMWAEYDSLTKYQRYEEQSYLVDVQQPMFEGDTFIRQDQKNYEYHNFAKKVLTGNENWETMRIQSNNIGYQFRLDNVAQGNRVSGIILSNSFVATTGEKAWDENNFGYKCGVDNFNMVRFSMPIGEYPVLDKFKAKLKELYEAGTPVIIYYKLAEPILLECTKAQNKVLDEIYTKAHTYKNITNISAESAEVNPIVNVKYLKDTETEHNKLQAQINEIKELLSSTETSSLLLDNIQKDLESEV